MPALDFLCIAATDAILNPLTANPPEAEFLGDS